MATWHNYPPVGTIIDDGCLRLMEVIGAGGYGVVYRATDVHSLTRCFYAVKCFIVSSTQRQSFIREIKLHQLVSSHPGVVTLYRVIEEGAYMYLVMDHAPDQDLFVQIIQKSRYLGNNLLIKDVFLQLLDAIEHCHLLGIYHRDLKPENVLCFEHGSRIAITDFGLATTHCISDEFRIGSAFHMSPECQTGDLDFEGVYSPQSCDIWSLGIILLNMVTTRNPWTTTSREDAAFRAYLDDPHHYLPTVLPISSELNDILVMLLNVEWRSRPSIPEIRAAVSQVNTFYSGAAIFEGKVARFLWETGLDLGTGVHKPGGIVGVSEPKEEKSYRVRNTGRSQPQDVIKYVPYPSFRLPLFRSRIPSRILEQSSPPITPSNNDSVWNRPLASRPSLSSIINSFQSFLHLCSSFNPSYVEKDSMEPESEMYTTNI